MAKTNKSDRKPVIDTKNAGFPSTNQGNKSGKKRAVVKQKVNRDKKKK
jgi:hypothetical protein